MTTVDGFVITPELVSLMKRWQQNEMTESYIPVLLDIQDYLSRLLGENLNDVSELTKLSYHINNLVGLRDELKDIETILKETN